MHSIGIASYITGNTIVSTGIRGSFAALRKVKAKNYIGVEVWLGSDVELCCVVAQSACTDSALDEELKQIQIVDFLIGVLKGNHLGQMVSMAMKMDSRGRDGIRMMDSSSLPVSPNYH